MVGKSIASLVICLLFCQLLTAQTFTFMGIEVDSVCTVVYDGKYNTLSPPEQPPKPAQKLEKKEYKKAKKDYKSQVDSLLGPVKRSREMKAFSVDVINDKGKFNPTILWSSKQCLEIDQLTELEAILSCEKKNPEHLSLSAKCFEPKHSVLLYRNGKVVSHYDVCFECWQVRFERKEFINCIDFIYLREFFQDAGYPIFDKDGEFEKYKVEHQ